MHHTPTRTHLPCMPLFPSTCYLLALCMAPGRTHTCNTGCLVVLKEEHLHKQPACLLALCVAWAGEHSWRGSELTGNSACGRKQHINPPQAASPSSHAWPSNKIKRLITCVTNTSALSSHLISLSLIVIFGGQHAFVRWRQWAAGRKTVLKHLGCVVCG